MFDRRVPGLWRHGAFQPTYLNIVRGFLEEEANKYGQQNRLSVAYTLSGLRS